MFKKFNTKKLAKKTRLVKEDLKDMARHLRDHLSPHKKLIPIPVVSGKSRKH